jgi:hypothetical protein
MTPFEPHPDPRPPSSEEIAHAAQVLRGGGLVAFPTETVYGLGADASNARAVARIFQAKGRPSGHPLIVHLASAQQMDDWAVEVPEAARILARQFWPGPLTLILRRSERVPLEVTGGQPTVGLRVPAHPCAAQKRLCRHTILLCTGILWLLVPSIHVKLLPTASSILPVRNCSKDYRSVTTTTKCVIRSPHLRFHIQKLRPRLYGTMPEQ